jgi:hypothetical protein
MLHLPRHSAGEGSQRDLNLLPSKCQHFGSAAAAAAAAAAAGQ